MSFAAKVLIEIKSWRSEGRTGEGEIISLLTHAPWGVGKKVMRVSPSILIFKLNILECPIESHHLGFSLEV